MRQITQRISTAFRNGRSLRIDNTYTDGVAIWLFGNKIAEYRSDYNNEPLNGLWITSAGWRTNTTKERLNGLPGVNITQRNHQWYLNGVAWDGNWIHVASAQPQDYAVALDSNDESYDDEFDVTSVWTKEKYSKPIYAVAETTNVAELDNIEGTLTDNGIATKRMESDTQGKYLVHHFVVVKPKDYDNAISIINQLKKLQNEFV